MTKVQPILQLSGKPIRNCTTKKNLTAAEKTMLKELRHIVGKALKNNLYGACLHINNLPR